MDYPSGVLTRTKKGNVEVRKLLDSGKFVRYEYVDPDTDQVIERKLKLVLMGNGETEEFFLVPTKAGRLLMIPSESKGDRMVWDGEQAVSIFGVGNDT
jgi:hypothetical protein